MKLIYHNLENIEPNVSPFDQVVQSLIKDNNISIACPYLNLEYILDIINLSHDFKLITDVKQWLMKDLVRILAALDCKNIKTYVQSGNAVFQINEESKDKIGERISLKVLESHGFKAQVILLEISELKIAILNNPFSIKDGKALHFFFLDSFPQKPDIEKLETLKSKSEMKIVSRTGSSKFSGRLVFSGHLQKPMSNQRI